MLGRVDETTTGDSEGTSTLDKEAWKAFLTPQTPGLDLGGLLGNCKSAEANVTRIPAPDSLVDSYANSLVEDLDYELTGNNSNAAAAATANNSARAAGSKKNLKSPGRGRDAPGRGNSPNIKFNIPDF